MLFDGNTWSTTEHKLRQGNSQGRLQGSSPLVVFDGAKSFSATVIGSLIVTEHKIRQGKWKKSISNAY